MRNIHLRLPAQTFERLTAGGRAEAGARDDPGGVRPSIVGLDNNREEPGRKLSPLTPRRWLERRLISMPVRNRRRPITW
jgi:hypothetical protein